MSKEIERKFVFNGKPKDLLDNEEIKIISQNKIIQNYLAHTINEEIRIRKILDEKSSQTILRMMAFKKGTGLEREEIEFSISEELYNQLQDSQGKKPLRKTRTTISFNEQNIEIDIYDDFDLVTIEVEFETKKKAVNYNLPNWFGEEITYQSEYKNKNLWLKIQ